MVDMIIPIRGIGMCRNMKVLYEKETPEK